MVSWFKPWFKDNHYTSLEGGQKEGIDDSRPLIELKDVVKTFEIEAGTFHALRKVDITIHKGEFVAVVGKSGSGKSTLINMITGIDRPTQGEVLVRGAAVHQMNENELAIWRGRTIGVVFQFFQLLPTLSVLDNVILPMEFANQYAPNERVERARALLDLVGLSEQAGKLPVSLSGGQQQRAAIARSLANDPPIIVADEPTGNLDSTTADAIFELFIERARQGRTVLMVTHDNSLAQRADRSIVVADGMIVGEGKV